MLRCWHDRPLRHFPLWPLLGIQVPFVLSEINCSTSRCPHSDFLCGEFREPCKAVGPSSFGVQLWQRAVAFFASNRSYRRIEYSHFDEAACEAGNAWIEIVHEGVWQQNGGSSAVLSASLASLMVTGSSIRLLQERPCLTPVNILPPAQCFDAVGTLEAAYPCNGTNWTSTDESAANISMNCASTEDCPIINEAYLGKTQYFTYNSSEAQACFYGANTNQALAWFNPQDMICVDRLSYLSCIPSPLSTSSTTLSMLWPVMLVALTFAHGWRGIS